MDTEKKNYEISFLVKDQEGSSIIESLLNQYNAEIFYKEALAETRLAYPIKKFNQAYFGFLHFRAFPDIIEKVIESLKLNSSVLRVLVITSPILKKEGASRISVKSKLSLDEKPLDKKIGPSPLTPSGGREALTNEALEKQLEEILK